MKTIDEMIAVMEASKTKPIQFKRASWMNDEWLDVIDQPRWNWCDYAFRVKPFPKDPQVLVGYRKPGQLVSSAHSQEFNVAMTKLVAGEAVDVTREYDRVEFIELTPEVKAKLGL